MKAGKVKGASMMPRQTNPEQPINVSLRRGCAHSSLGAGTTMDKLTRDKLAPFLIGGGVLLVVSPVILYWFIHGDPERYLWIINGPPPFSSFGSGPFQLYMYAGLTFSGLLLTALGIVALRRRRFGQPSTQASSAHAVR